jgi:RNA polymerase sigma-70 factor (ECF subfamily)
MPPPPVEHNGSKLTAEQVFHQYAPRVFHLARRILGNDADAEDVTQDVLLQVVRKLDSFRGDSDLFTWLHRVTVNAAIAHRSRRARREEHELHDAHNHFLESGSHAKPMRPWSVGTDQQALNHEREKMIETAIARLPETYRDVFVLADVEGLSNAEIGDMLQLSLPAVKSRLHRSRMMMRDALAPHFEEVQA